MPAIKKKTGRTVRRKTATGRKSTAKPRTSKRAKTAAKPRNPLKPSRPRKIEEATFAFECTRPGCGYRIWREEKEEAGHLRFDLKCPKCHHKVFKCLGKSEPPETFEAPLPEPEQLELVDVSSLGLDSD